MKGSILPRTKDKSGKPVGPWRITVSLGKGTDGKYKRHRETVDGTKADAQRRLREILSQVDSGIYVKPSKLTVGQYLERWAETYAALNTSPRTAISYKAELRRHIVPGLGAIGLGALRPHDIERFYVQELENGRKDGKEGGLSPRTVVYHHRILSEALEHAVRHGEIARNPAKLVSPPRPKRAEIKTLNTGDIARFLEAASVSEYFPLLLTALYTGARVGELLALAWRNVNLNAATMNIEHTLYRTGNTWEVKEPKSARSRRQIDLPHSVVAALRDHRTKQQGMWEQLGRTLTENDFVFGQVNGKPRDERSVLRGLQRVLNNAGLPHIRMHDLRHTHASLLLKAGVHPKVVSERLGHGSVSLTLDVYSHVMPGVQREAVGKLETLLTGGGK